MRRKAMNEPITSERAVYTPADVSFYTVEEIQKLMGIGKASAYALVKKKNFPSITVGKRIIIPADLMPRK
jgi:excisionase family DNA binding protein